MKFNDYYSFINKDWFKNFTIPDDYSRFGTFEEIYLNMENQVGEILNDCSNNQLENSFNNLLLKNMYLKLDKKDDISSLNKYFKLIDNCNDLDDILKIIGLFNILNVSLFFNLSIEQDLKDSMTYLIYLNQNSTMLPSKDYYIDDKYNDICIKYKGFINSILKLINMESYGDQIYEFEKSIALLTLKKEDKRDLDMMYNISNFNEINRIFNFENFLIYFKILKPDIDKYYNKIIVDNFKYYNDLITLLKNTDLNLIKIYIKYIFIISFGDYLTSDIYDLIFSFFKKELSGVIKPVPENKKKIDILSELIGEIISQIYINKYYSEEINQNIKNLIDKIIKSSIDIISKCSWMDPKTKIKAIDKINNIKIKIGYRKKIKNYTSININDLNLIDSITKFNIFYSNFYLNKLGSNPDPDEWHMNSYETNAYYNPLINEIVFPAGILQLPMFSLENSFATNLGGIGSVIAHEISHAFDDQGHKFDKNGNMISWWTKDDENKYLERANNLVDQFNKIKIFDINISGKMTLGENIADYTAVTIIVNVLKQNNLTTRYNYHQLFSAYAQVWKHKIRKNELIKRLNNDVHAPGRYRTNQILSNINEFYETYNIDENHKMYIKNNNRIKLWE